MAKTVAQKASSRVAGMRSARRVRDGLPELIGDAEIALRGLHEIARELHGHGIVETEGAAHLLALGSRRIDGDDLVHRIAGEAEHRKGDDPDGQQERRWPGGRGG